MHDYVCFNAKTSQLKLRSRNDFKPDFQFVFPSGLMKLVHDNHSTHRDVHCCKTKDSACLHVSKVGAAGLITQILLVVVSISVAHRSHQRQV